MNKILIIVAIFFLTGCGADYSIPDNNSAQPAITSIKGKSQNLVTFKVNGEQVRTTGWTISRFVWKTNTSKVLLNITSNMHDDKRTISVNLDGAEPGNYLLAENTSINKKSYGSYYPDYIDDQVNSFSFASGNFELIEVDTVKNRVNGSFYGTVKNLRGDSFEITEGKIINGLLKAGITNY